MIPRGAALHGEAHVWIVALPDDAHVRGTAARQAAVHAALDAAVAAYAPEASVVHRAGRRPEVRGAPLFVSLAHTKTLALVAIADSPVGVDLEPFRTAPPASVVRQLVSRQEQAALLALSRSERDRAFVDAWARKEAALKAAGVGLSVDPRTVEVGIDRRRARLVTLPGDQAVTVIDLSITGHGAAVAFLGYTPPDVRMRRDGLRSAIEPLV